MFGYNTFNTVLIFSSVFGGLLRFILSIIHTIGEDISIFLRVLIVPFVTAVSAICVTITVAFNYLWIEPLFEALRELIFNPGIFGEILLISAGIGAGIGLISYIYTYFNNDEQKGLAFSFISLIGSVFSSAVATFFFVFIFYLFLKVIEEFFTV